MATGKVDFLSPDSKLYTGSFTLPAGKWAIWFTTKLQQPKEGAKFTNPRLGVLLTCVSLERAGEPVEQFLSMGSKAHEAFVPSADGKGIEPIVGGSGTLTNKSNWNLFRDSMFNAGLDRGVASDSLEALDGIWVETTQEAEPEERKSFKTATGEVEEANKQPGKIPAVIAILDGGKPWEGGGGMPDFGAKAAPKKPGPVAVAKPGPVKTAPVAAAEGDTGDPDAVQSAAVNAIGEVLGDEKYTAGAPKLILKTQVFQRVEKANGKAMAQAVTEAYFKTDALTAPLMGELGYKLEGTKWVPQS